MNPIASLLTCGADFLVCTIGTGRNTCRLGSLHHNRRRIIAATLTLATLLFALPLSLRADDPATSTTPTSQPTPKPNPPSGSTIPAPRDAAWIKRHEAYVADAKKGNIDVLFMGDSITDGFHGGGQAVWKTCYAPLHAANFGIGGDRTEHVLWRLDNGEADGIKPKVVVLMIGTNNIGDTSENVTKGVLAVIKDIRTRLPDSKLLLLGIFPRSANPTDKVRDKIKGINDQLAKQDDGTMIKYLDIGKAFLSDDGTITKEIMADALHPTPKGYYLWANAMNPTLESMLGEKVPAPEMPPPPPPKPTPATVPATAPATQK